MQLADAHIGVMSYDLREEVAGPMRTLALEATEILGSRSLCAILNEVRRLRDVG